MILILQKVLEKHRQIFTESVYCKINLSLLIKSTTLKFVSHCDVLISAHEGRIFDSSKRGFTFFTEF
jgi:hypothetical protein